MTDPLSTIRQNATWLVEANPEDLDGQLAKGILTACDDLEAERLTLKTAIGEAEYALHPNQGEQADPTLASQILRSTWPKDHPNYTPHPEAERLTPEEARGILDVLPQELWWWGGPSESQLAWLAKLEKWAGE